MTDSTFHAFPTADQNGFDGDDACWAVAAQHGPSRPGEGPRQSDKPGRRKSAADPLNLPGTHEVLPRTPRSLAGTGVSTSQIEALILKYLLNCGTATGRRISEQLKLPFRFIEDLLRGQKDERLVVYKATAAGLSDFVYELTEQGINRARRYSQQCTYCGAAPVSLPDYIKSVQAQSMRRQSPKRADFQKAFGDLLLRDEIIGQIGQAVASGLGLFLHGEPGNGKTSIAERVTRAFRQAIWIPRAISVWGEIIRLYDPSNHEELPLDESRLSEEVLEQIDRRWIRVRRPTIVAGGELTMDNLEVKTIAATGISEAPLQLKSNCGTLVIDDFGRQRISPTDLLNRWIVPLEKRHDYLNLTSGRKIEIPFEQLVIFSTNLQPNTLVDEAFLRRIPYKIDVPGPTEADFRRLFTDLAGRYGLECGGDVLDHLVNRHFHEAGREMRYCHPRDLLHQVQNYCTFNELPAVVTHEAIEAAVKNYFTMMA